MKKYWKKFENYKKPESSQAQNRADDQSLTGRATWGRVAEEDGTVGKGKNVIKLDRMPEPKPNAEPTLFKTLSHALSTQTLETPTELAKEAYTEQGGGAPNVGNNNYAQNLPAQANPKLTKNYDKSKSPLYKKLMSKQHGPDKGTPVDLFPKQEGIVYDMKDVMEAVDEARFLVEALKVGEGEEDEDALKKTGVKGAEKGVKKIRKYLGNGRGTTATGKPAHAIDIMPEVKADPNVNKTIPAKSKTVR